jgi:hypothetical protein
MPLNEINKEIPSDLEGRSNNSVLENQLEKV